MEVEINIPDTAEKGNTPSTLLPNNIVKRIFVPALIIAVGVGGYGLGKLGTIAESRVPVTIEQDTSTGSASSPQASSGQATSTGSGQATMGKYVASRGGTAYYLPSCAASGRIAEKNKIWFETREEAERLGYKPAKNCKGL